MISMYARVHAVNLYFMYVNAYIIMLKYCHKCYMWWSTRWVAKMLIGASLSKPHTSNKFDTVVMYTVNYEKTKLQACPIMLKHLSSIAICGRVAVHW